MTCPEHADEFQWPEGLCAPTLPCHRCSGRAIIGFDVGTNILCLCESCVRAFGAAIDKDGYVSALEGMVEDIRLSHAPIGGNA